ncbi:MAG: choice-of-anchor Q domain-containing protein [Dokdonella sp.]|uniref:choice-of-anchor Q domain-containing protein n=1 Tax=Dokdonella sp. TaxID=2291710 RepID=UPI003F7EB2D0
MHRTGAPWQADRFASLRAGPLEPAAPAETLTVTNCNDTGPGSLRQAILDASDGARIEFAMACSTITLGSGPLFHPDAGSLRIAAPIRNVDGRPQPTITIDAGGHSRVIEHRGQGQLQLEGLALVNGRSFAVNTDAEGGCVRSEGRVVVTGVSITDCVTEARGPNGAALGGGIWSDDVVGLVHSTVSGNTAQAVTSTGYSYGGGVFAARGFYAAFSTIEGNQATAFGYGGGVGCRGPVAIVSSSVIGNSAAAGGGLGLFGGPDLGSGSVYMNDSTIAYNSATFFAGGIEVSAEFHVYNSTIAGNIGASNGRGNGIIVEGSHPLTLVSTIVHGNTVRDIQGASSVAGSANLVGISSVPLPAGTSSADPQLGALALHGGLTPVRDLQPGSPAIDAGANPLELPCDQRGGMLVSLEFFTMVGRHERVAGARADIGAFEVGAGEQMFQNGFEFVSESCYRER